MIQIRLLSRHTGERRYPGLVNSDIGAGGVI